MAKRRGAQARRASPGEAEEKAGSDGKGKAAAKVKVRTEPKVEGELPRALPPPAAAALVFVAAGAVLMLEILAVRLLAPYVGLTLETTTAIIGAALAGISIGAAVGGYFADRTNTRLLIVGLLVGGGLLTLLTVPAVRWLGPGAREQGSLAALGITVVALVPAASVLSAVSPSVAHLQLHDLRVSGTIVGRLSAWATAGALLGTFGTGFVLVPLIPVTTSVLLIGAMLILIGLGLAMSSSLVSPAGIAGLAIAAIALGALTVSRDSPCTRETKYTCIRVQPDAKRSTGYELILNDTYNSYVDIKDPSYLGYPYIRWLAAAIDAKVPPPKPLDMVFVGGGAFTLPRWLEATHPGSDSQTLEVDQGVVDIDEERLGLRTSADLRSVVGDARITMRDVPSNSADVVVGDAFSGFTVPWHLTTKEWLEEVKRVLRPEGLYAMNIIDLGPLEFFKAETATLLEVFSHVEFLTYPKRNGDPYGDNMELLASDRPIAKPVGTRREGGFLYRQPVAEALAEGAEPLRDDYAPVDQLRTFEP
jgi:MFS family permease